VIKATQRKSTKKNAAGFAGLFVGFFFGLTAARHRPCNGKYEEKAPKRTQKKKEMTLD